VRSNLSKLFSCFLVSLCFLSLVANPSNDRRRSEILNRLSLCAAKDNDFAFLIRESKQKNFDPNICDEFGMSLLHYAANNENRLMVAFLVGCGANIKQENNDGYTPANCTGDSKIAEFFAHLLGLNATTPETEVSLTIGEELAYLNEVLRSLEDEDIFTLISCKQEGLIDQFEEKVGSEVLLSFAIERGSTTLMAFLLGTGIKLDGDMINGVRDRDIKAILHWAEAASSGGSSDGKLYEQTGMNKNKSGSRIGKLKRRFSDLILLAS